MSVDRSLPNQRIFMPPVLTFPQSTTVPSPGISEVAAVATCPGCHTTEPSLTMSAVAAGATWLCRRCTQRWGAGRLAAVAAYMEWHHAHASSPIDQATPTGRGR